MTKLYAPPPYPQTLYPATRLRQAKVASMQVGPPPTLTLFLAGDTVNTVTGVRFLWSYEMPQANDVVWVLQSGPDYLVLGKLAPSETDIYIVKPTDEPITSNTTVQDDDHLKFFAEANAVYMTMWSVRHEGAEDTGDFKVQIDVPAGATILGNVWYPKFIGSGSVSGATTLVRLIGADPLTVGCNGAGSVLGYHAHGVVTTGSTAGDVKLRWAQVTSNAIATKVLANSWLMAHRMM